MTGFYLARHGNTFSPGEAPVRIGCRTDLPLTDEGERQARALGEWFAAHGITFDRALTGPLMRTRRTAELILAAGQSAAKLDTADLLGEIDHGEDEGKPDAYITARVGPAAMQAWDEHGIAPSGWIVDREARIDAWRRLFAFPGSGRVLLVTSNGAARFAVLAVAATRPPSLRLRTGAFGRIERSASGALMVAEWDVRP